MNRNFLLLALLAITLSACASRPRPITVSPAERLRCAGVSDSVSKYVSMDALPFAYLVGTPRVLPVPPALRPGDSITVEFLVLPEGLADPSSVEINGSSDPAFARSVLQLVTESSFVPARLTDCNVLSKYSLVIKPTA